jgi:hypothetical protein
VARVPAFLDPVHMGKALVTHLDLPQEHHRRLVVSPR